MKITRVKARSDNWTYLISDDDTRTGVVVDPYNANAVTAEAKKLGVEITILLATHYQEDQSGGNLKFLESTPVPCLGGSSRVPGLTHQVVDNVTFKIGENVKVKCIHTPCHAEDSICYYVQDSKTGEQAVFTGATLLTAGCDSFFEGTVPQMDAYLKKLMLLPNECEVYTCHDYTQGSTQLDAMEEPLSSDLRSHISNSSKGDCDADGYTTGDETKWLFARTGVVDEKKADEVDVVQKLMQLKNGF